MIKFTNLPDLWYLCYLAYKRNAKPNGITSLVLGMRVGLLGNDHWCFDSAAKNKKAKSRKGIECKISQDPESLIIGSGLSIDKPLMIDYICYFTIHRKSWTKSWKLLIKNSIHCRYQLIHVHAHLLLLINFARKAGIDNTVYDATGSL